MATPMRSFTDDNGLKNSSFNRMSARTLAAAVIFDSRTSGVCPMVSAIEIVDAAATPRLGGGKCL